jgi:signal transduction histidine kinase
MRMPSVFGFGLRPRLLAAFVLTSAVTLGVAALALLSPLEQRLESSSETTVFAAISTARTELHEIPLERGTDQPQRRELQATLSLLRRQVTAQAVVLDKALEVVSRELPADLDLPVYFPEAKQALRIHRGVHKILSGNVLVAARPVEIGNRPFVLVVVKRLDFLSSAVGDVESAFAVAAAAGLGIAVLIGIGLSSRLVRRLRRLRDKAREVEHGRTVAFDADPGNDELGELAHTLQSMQERLAHQDSALRAFVATASHELRTPLTSLDGLLELIEDDLDARRLDLQDARERTARAREQSQRLSGLASDLLDLSRLDAEVSLRSEPVELTELARAVVAEMELRASTEDITVSVHAPSQPAWVTADPGAVARVVRILLDNALRISPEGSAIDVEIAPFGASPAGDRDSFELVVRDEGPGVPSEERELIFERFRRGTRTAGHGGFGLGLAIGRELTTRMGGTLELLQEHSTPQPGGSPSSVNGAPDTSTNGAGDSSTNGAPLSGANGAALPEGHESARRFGGAAFALRLPALPPDAGDDVPTERPRAQRSARRESLAS